MSTTTQGGAELGEHTQLREQIVRTTYMSAAAQAELTCGELFRQLVEAAAGRYRSDIWVPKRVDFGNVAFNRAYQIAQRLIDSLLDRFPRRWRGCAQEFRVSADFHPKGHPRLEGIPLAPDLPATQDRETSYRQIDGVLWQAEDPWPYPSMLIELDIERTASVRNHLIAACHIANHSDRPVTLLYVAGYKAMAHVRRTIHSEFYGNQLADKVLCQAAKVRLRLVGLKAALATNPLECPHVIDETFTRTLRY